MKRLICLLLLIPFFGCASFGDRAQFYQAQKEFYAAQAQQPVFKMEAVPGKAIENLASIVVYNAQTREFRQFSEEHPGYRLAERIVGFGSFLAGGYFISEAFKTVAGLSHGATTSYTNTISGTGNSGYISPMTIGNVQGAGNTFGGFYTADPTVVYAPDPVVFYAP